MTWSRFLLTSALVLTACEHDPGVSEENALVERTLLETLRYRNQHHSTRFDGVIRELARQRCGAADAARLVIDVRAIDDLFPPDAVAVAVGVGCAQMILR